MSYGNRNRFFGNKVKTPVSFTPNQIALQTALANGLIEKRNVSFVTNIANASRATVKQLFWVDKMVQEILDKQEKSVTANSPALIVAKIFTLFDNARKHLKFPKIALRFADGAPIRLATSRNWTDTIFVSAGGYGTENFARVMRDGSVKMFLKGAQAAELQTILSDFANDPEKVAQEYGKLTHNCCYCLKALDTAESLAVGYGPICAKHYGLSWGKNTPRSKPNVKELLEVVGTTIQTAGMALDQEMNELLADF